MPSIILLIMLTTFYGGCSDQGPKLDPLTPNTPADGASIGGIVREPSGPGIPNAVVTLEESKAGHSATLQAAATRALAPRDRLRIRGTSKPTSLQLILTFASSTSSRCSVRGHPGSGGWMARGKAA